MSASFSSVRSCFELEHDALVGLLLFPMPTVTSRRVEVRSGLESLYVDVLTPQVLSALDMLAPFDNDRKAVMASRIGRRTARARNRERLTFLDPDATIART